MKTHEVIVTYMADSKGQHIVLVDPLVSVVEEGDEIKFTRRGDLPGTLRVKFTDTQLFQFFGTNNPDFAQNGEFHEPDGTVRVKKTLPHRTSYNCQMLGEDKKTIIAERKGDEGGHVEPVEPQSVKNPP